jgi:hypothetical protein
MAAHEKILRPDSTGRISLGRKRTKSISGYKLIEMEDGSISLIPQVEIPASELWLYKNKSALEAVTKGIEQSISGQLKKRVRKASVVANEND